MASLSSVVEMMTEAMSDSGCTLEQINAAVSNFRERAMFRAIATNAPYLDN